MYRENTSGSGIRHREQLAAVVFDLFLEFRLKPALFRLQEPQMRFELLRMRSRQQMVFGQSEGREQKANPARPTELMK